jgi:hypothetical protein
LSLPCAAKRAIPVVLPALKIETACTTVQN